MKKLLQTLVLAVFVALAAPAWALGLGQLKLKSGPNQPLLAEIPVISTDPAELERLQARLAAPETFLRVGLPLPDKMVSDLQFSIAKDSEGKPVIRVTSPGPVAIPMLTFLLEVDWGEGRLVREYSVLVAAPESVEAAAVPEIEAAESAPSNTIVRDAEGMAAQTPQPEPEASPANTAAAEPAPAAAPTPTMSAPAAGSQTLPAVQRGQTLSGIASAMKQPGQDLQTVMAALLLANPQAFINGNPHRLREGAVMQLPAGDAASGGFSSAEVEAMAAQLAQWRSRSGRRGRAVDVASAASDSPAARRSDSAAAANQRRSARLEITPAAASAGAATRSGPGGDGDALMAQQLQEARETIAARDAEVAELKSRVAELETLKEQQNQLIQMKDGELALAQQQLKAHAQTRANNDSAGTSSMLLWSALGVLLLAGIVFAVWILRQRKQQTWKLADKSSAEGASTVAKPLPQDLDQLFEPEMPEDNAVVADPEVALSGGEATAWDDFQNGGRTATKETNTPATVRTLGGMPSWAGAASQSWEENAEQYAGISLKPLTDDPAKIGAWTFPVDAGEQRVEGFANQAQPVLPDAVPAVPLRDESAANADIARPFGHTKADSEAGDGRLILARTYIELGDHGTARLLLQQVLDDGNSVYASEARQLLDSLG